MSENPTIERISELDFLETIYEFEDELAQNRLDHITFSSIAAMQADETLEPGDTAIINGAIYDTLEVTEVEDESDMTDPDIIYLYNDTYYKGNSGKEAIGFVSENGFVVVSDKNTFVTPEMFGAKGDGVADDKNAIQDAIDSSYPIVFRNNYAVSDSIMLRSNVKMIGYNKSNIAAIDNGSTYYAILRGTNLENVKIEGLSFTGLKHWTGVTISGPLNDRGILISGDSKNIKVLNCKFLNFGAAAVTVNGVDCMIQNNTIDYTGVFSGSLPNYNFGIEYDFENSYVSDNVITGTITAVISGLVNKNNHLIGNTIKTAINGQHGFYMESAENVTIENNIIDAAICGVKYQRNHAVLTTYENGNIIGNHITGGKQAVLIVDLISTGVMKKFLVENNTLRSPERCVELIRSEEVVISNNVMEITDETPTSYILRISESNHVNVDGNTGIGFYYGVYYTEDGPNTNQVLNANQITMKNSSHAGKALTLAKGDVISITGNIIEHIGSNADTDGYYFPCSAASDIGQLVLACNVSKGFRWGARATNSPILTQAGNNFNTQTGI